MSKEAEKRIKEKIERIRSSKAREVEEELRRQEQANQDRLNTLEKKRIERETEDARVLELLRQRFNPEKLKLLARDVLLKIGAWDMLSVIKPKIYFRRQGIFLKRIPKIGHYTGPYESYTSVDEVLQNLKGAQEKYQRDANYPYETMLSYKYYLEGHDWNIHAAYMTSDSKADSDWPGSGGSTYNPAEFKRVPVSGPEVSSEIVYHNAGNLEHEIYVPGRYLPHSHQTYVEGVKLSYPLGSDIPYDRVRDEVEYALINTHRDFLIK